MDRLGVIGISWRHADSAWVARCTLPEESRAERLMEWSQRFGLDEVLYLATCSRVELVFRSRTALELRPLRRALFEAWTGTPGEPGDAERWLRAWEGEGAAEHLLMVATGLDSAQLGETEILGQFRTALALSRELGLAGGVLGWVGEEALRIARKLRSASGIDQGRTSLAQIALQRIRSEAKAQGLSVGLLGVSPMTERCATDLAAEKIPIVWINRTEARAAERLAQLGAIGTALSLDAFLNAPVALACLVSATGAPGLLLDGPVLTALAAQNPRLVLIDLAVQPDINAQAARAAGLVCLGIDAILEKAHAASLHRENRAAEARLGIDAALDHLRDLSGVSALAPMARAVQAHYHQAAHNALERLFRTELSDLRDDQKQCLLRWSQHWAGQMAHLPTTGLREVIREQGPAALAAYLRHAQPELAQTIQSAMESYQHETTSEEPV